MKSKVTLVITNIVMLALGVVLILFNGDERMAEMIAIALGVLFLAPSLFSLIMLFFVNVPMEDSRYNPRYNLLPVIGGLSFGLVIVFKAPLFVPFLKYLFAVLLIVGGLYYVFYLAFARSRLIVPSWYYVLPCAVAASGIVALVMPISSNSIIFITAGVSMIALALMSVLLAFAERAAAKMRAEELAKTQSPADVEALQVNDDAQ
ncbi:MAG: hypothetical protein ACI4AH_02815 [Muribaculaceae bacterium]